MNPGEQASPHMFAVTPDIQSKMESLYGPKVKQWLTDLPSLLGQCAIRFRLTLQAPVPKPSWNLIFHARQPNGTPVVLKLGFAKHEINREFHVLRALQGRGVVRAIDGDERLGAMVLERVIPGIPLSATVDDATATQVYCDVSARLHRPCTDHQYPSISEHFAAINRYRLRVTDHVGPIPARWIDRATVTLAELLASAPPDVLLHGDLHHGNILQSADEWKVIDPKGIVGDPHFEPIQYLLNYQTQGGDADTVLRSRIDLISQRLQLDSRRIALWGTVRGVLEACWRVEDGQTDWPGGISISEAFSRYLGEP